MAEVKFSAEQMDKLKNAMSRVSRQTGSGTKTAAVTLSEALASGQVGTEKENAAKPQDVDPAAAHLGKGTYLRVDNDEMAAWLYLTPPEPGQYYTKGDLVTFLQHKGVIKGFHSSNLSAMIKKKVYNREILVAQGAQCIDGKDGYFEYLFTPEEYGAPKIREDGSVDYTNMSALQNVHKGDKVAVYHYAVQGMDGYTVYGAEIKSKPAKDLPPIRGKGINRENNEYFAMSDGKIEAKAGKIDIQNVHEIMGDVTMIIGKVEFFGDVIINGNVESGVTIRAGRNIEIHGTTGCATLFAGGDVILSRGIQGGGKISARGSVFADFIENTTVEAGGMVQSNTILNAYVSAGDKVVLTGRRGCIIGGYVHGLKGIEAMTAGNDMEVKTILHCGYEAESYDRLVELRQQEHDVKEKLSELVETMSEALREKRMRGSSTSAATEAKLLEWDKTKNQYFAQLDEIEKDKQILEKVMEGSQGASIKVDGNLHRNVIIGVNAEQMIIDKDTRFMKFNADKGCIEASVMVR